MKVQSVLFVIIAALGFLGVGCAGSQMNVQIRTPVELPARGVL